MNLIFFFQIAVLIMSVVIHEVSHGYAARALGDHTAEYQGRLTLNPLKHLDPFGSVILPAISILFAGFVIGWARPVPYNPYNLRPGRWSEAMVAAAGPISNIFIFTGFGLVLRLAMANGVANTAFIQTTAIIILVNIVLAVFNLIPVPPLDGSKLLFALFPEKLYQMRATFERYGFIILLFIIFFAWSLISPIVKAIFEVVTGIPF